MKVRTPNDLGLVIRERRRALGFDQRGLADLVGVSRQWIVEIEKGKARAEVGLILRTLTTLGLQLRIEEDQANPSVTPEADIDAVIDRARGKKP